VTLQELKTMDGPDIRQGLSLTLTVHPGEGSTFPYDIEMEMLGVFNADGFKEAERHAMLLVNGASMLYGAMREMLMTITYRCMHGPVLLPSVHFIKLEQDYREKQAKIATKGTAQEAKKAKN
jgi:preprotein translocase subunit SecB